MIGDVVSGVAVVTGGATGIGFAAAQELHSRGFSLAICSRGHERLDEAAAELGADDRVLSVAGDVGDVEFVRHLVDATVARFGGLDVVVNAAGVIGDFVSIEDASPADWERVLRINLMGSVNTTAAAVPHLRARGGGAIVNVASTSAYQAEPLMAPYGVSKAALVAFTKYASCELAPHRIRVNGVSPGWIRTPMGEPFFEDAGVVGKVWETNFLGRAGEPAEMAKVIAFLASEDSSFMTGETVVADGGHVINMMPLRPRE